MKPSELMRWDCTEDGMEQNPEYGDYVRWVDVAPLLAEIEELRQDLGCISLLQKSLSLATGEKVEFVTQSPYAIATVHANCHKSLLDENSDFRGALIAQETRVQSLTAEIERLSAELAEARKMRDVYHQRLTDLIELVFPFAEHRGITVVTLESAFSQIATKFDELQSELTEQKKQNLELSVDFHKEKNRLKAELAEVRRLKQ